MVFILLGITTVLTLTSFIMDTRDDLPAVPYATALDVFITVCFAFVIGAMLEFAGVHYFTKVKVTSFIADGQAKWGSFRRFVCIPHSHKVGQREGRKVKPQSGERVRW